MTDLERVKSWLSHGDEVEQELAADVVAHLKEDAEAWRGAMEYRKQLQAQRYALLAAMRRIGNLSEDSAQTTLLRNEALRIARAAIAEVEGEKP